MVERAKRTALPKTIGVTSATRTFRQHKRAAPVACRKLPEGGAGPLERAQVERETIRWTSMRRRLRASARRRETGEQPADSIDIGSWDDALLSRAPGVAGAHDVAARLMVAAAIDASEGLGERLRSGSPVVVFDVADDFDLATVETCWREVIFGDDDCATSPVLQTRNSMATDPLGFHLVVKDKPRPASDASRRREALSALAAARPVVALSPDASSHLPDVLLRAGAVRLTLGALAPRTIAETIRIVTGGRIRGGIEPALASRIGLAEIGIAVRFDRSATACLSLLRDLAAAKVRHVDARDLTLDDMHGMPAAVRWSRSFVRDVESFRNGGPWVADSGVVFDGPSGVGKTTIVRVLANAAKVPLLVGGYTRWQSYGQTHLGSLMAKMAEDFANAKRLADADVATGGGGCSIMFVDELDSFADRSALSASHPHRSYDIKATNAFIACCDSLGGSDGNEALSDARFYRKPRVVLIGATNDWRRCDPAVLRSGRFNRVISIGYPDAEALQAMMRVRLSGDLVDEDLSDLALMAAGHTGADIERVVADARRLARHAGRDLTLDDLKAAFGAPQLSARRRARVAVHEAAHLMIDVLLSGPSDVFAVMTGVGNRLAGQFRRVDDDSPGTFADHFRSLMVLLAGRAGEAETYGSHGDGSGGDWGSDLQQATTEACAMTASFGVDGPPLFLGPVSDTRALLAYPEVRSRVTALLARAERACRRLVSANRTALGEIAALLDADGRIDGTSVAAILAAHGTAAPITVSDFVTLTGKENS
jgi:AAA+ superfamily predicted ATPase